MVISEPAVICLESAWMRLLRFLRLHDAGDPSLGRIDKEDYAPFVMDQRAGQDQDSLPDERSDIAGWTAAHTWPGAIRSEPGAETLPTDAPAQFDLDRRRTQAALLRAMLLARRRRFAEAEAAFAEAASLDPGCDLTATDGFWELERAGHDAAAHAYETSGRPRDALLLRAKIDARYRPRLVRTA
ncbi:MAG: hypothetical protein IT337_06240 [Thermomicrobiales bacterium]|nr:hypothetical protein [Thermomicrobiales bacterium]